MTSYPKRIQVLNSCIQNFYKSQTIKPDKFYIWLSYEEFSNKELDLPKDLLETINKYKIELKWLKDNLYVFKRFMIYPKHHQDYCFFIDDDVFYSPTLIQDSLTILKQYPNTICNLWLQFTAIPLFKGIKRIGWDQHLNNIKNIKYWLCGNCAISPNTFPLECFNYLNIFKQYAEGNDELFLIPFVLKNNIQISFIPKYYQFINLKNSQQESVCKKMDEIYNNTAIKKHDIILYNILKNTNTLDIFKKIHITYGDQNVK